MSNMHNHAQLGACFRYPNATNTLFWFADDQGDTDPNVVVLDAYVDVALQNTSTPLPYALDDNADSLVRPQLWLFAFPAACTLLDLQGVSPP